MPCAEHNIVGSALEAESRGDAGMLSATGYPLAGENTAATTPPEVIDNLKLTSGDLDGALDGSFDPDPLARIYEVQLTSVDPVAGPWNKVLNSTTSSFQLTGLTSGQRAAGSGQRAAGLGPRPWSGHPRRRPLERSGDENRPVSGSLRSRWQWLAVAEGRCAPLAVVWFPRQTGAERSPIGRDALRRVRD